MHRKPLLTPARHPSSSLAPSGLAGLGMVLFDVPSARDLVARCAKTDPAARFSKRRCWFADPGEDGDGLLARLTSFASPGHGRAPCPATPLWFWPKGEEELLAQANIILLQFVHPLVARGLPYRVGFPFGADVLAPRSLTVAERARLDLEDIGVLLHEGGGSPRPSPGYSTDEVGARLDPAQRAAVEHAYGAARVLAPAGSGKTKTLVSRVFELVARGVDPARILLLAFNTKAAAQLEERLQEHGIATTRRISPDASPPSVHCATFNAFGARYQREIMRVRPEVDAHGGGRRALMLHAMEAAGFGLPALKPARGADPVADMLAALDHVRAALEDPEGIAVPVFSTADPPVAAVPFGPVHACYSHMQALSGRQSFDDQVYLAVADMLTAPEHRRCMQRRYEHILVDEFQDLNGAQLALVDLLSRPHRDLFVVGDDDQLIYGWRFADPSGILRFHERLPPRPWSATYTLGTNYRCSRAVVEAAARLVANNSVREPKDVRPRAGAQEGAVRFVAAPSWAERAAAICTFLRTEKARLGCAWRDLAVLCRYRSQQLVVALALDGENVPRAPQLGGRLFSHPAARQLRACIDMVRTPGAIRGDLGRLPLCRLDRSAHAELAERVEALHVEFQAAPSDTLSPADERSAPGSPIAPSACSADSALEPLTAARLISTVIDVFALDKVWQLPSPDTKDAPGSTGGPAGIAPHDEAGPFQIVDSLILLAEAIPVPTQYLATWDRLQIAEEAGIDAARTEPAREEEGPVDGVVIGTIHSAKGREYQAVVIPDYDCDVTRWSPSEIEEERRVVYVGVTRARDTVLVTVNASRPYVHPFVRELVEAPHSGEHASLVAQLLHEQDQDATLPSRRRVAEIEALFPELASPAQTAREHPRG
ncbi:MAG TPA: ATP-dependent helicase [Thermoleophilia bacterium]|nr:ATP-dependent helicase [Thermoleophilia bacterium]